MSKFSKVLGSLITMSSFLIVSGTAFGYYSTAFTSWYNKSSLHAKWVAGKTGTSPDKLNAGAVAGPFNPGYISDNSECIYINTTPDNYRYNLKYDFYTDTNYTENSKNYCTFSYLLQCVVDNNNNYILGWVIHDPGKCATNDGSASKVSVSITGSHDVTGKLLGTETTTTVHQYLDIHFANQ